MESILNLLVASILLAIPIIIFFAGFFIIFGQTFRTVNALYSFRFSESFNTFVLHNEGYPFTITLHSNKTVPVNNYTLLFAKGGFAYVEYEPVKNNDINLAVYPEEKTFFGIADWKKAGVFEAYARDFGYDYVRKRFSLGDGYDILIADAGTKSVYGIMLPDYAYNYIGAFRVLLKYPAKKVAEVCDATGGCSASESDKKIVDTSLFYAVDFSSSGLLSNWGKNSITPPTGIINAPVVLPNGSTTMLIMPFAFYVNGKVYGSINPDNYFEQKPRAEVYVEVLTPSTLVYENDIVAYSALKPKDYRGVVLIVSISKNIPDYSKLEDVKLVINYKYATFNWATQVIHPKDVTASFFIIPLDYEKSIPDNVWKYYKDREKTLRVMGSVTYLITYNGERYAYTTPFVVEYGIEKT